MGQRFEGRNLDDALENASAALGVERYLLLYHVVVEKRGFLGAIKRIVIEASVSDTPLEAPAVARPPIQTPGPPVSRGSGERKRAPGRRGREGGDDQRRGRHDERRERPPDDEVLPPQTEESPEALEVRRWFETVVGLAKLDLEIRTSEDEEAIRLVFYGASAAQLLDRGGELLDSLQVLANKGLVGRTVSKSIELDCHRFKEKRVDALTRQARELAEVVRQEGREQLLPAMSPVERRIVHLSLQDDEDVATESRGEGFYKRVAIIPRSEPESPGES